MSGNYTSPYVTRANNYARKIVAGKIDACLYVRQACQRHIDDLAAQDQDDFEYRFDVRAGHRVCKFAEKLPHIKGSWAGTKIRLEDWQCFILVCIFGWLTKSNGRRRFREVYAEIPRKNGKSILAAIIGLYMLVADGEAGAEVFSGATSRKQAWEVFKPARMMAQKAQGFKQNFGVTVNASNLAIDDTGSKFEPLIGKPGDGASPSCALVDEYHEHQTPDLYDTMITGMGAREQPLAIIITTAGTNIGGPCYDKRTEIVSILNGTIDADKVFGIIYTIDADDDWTDLKVWRKANPNFGISVYDEYLDERRQEGMRRASRQNIIKCKHLNVWASAMNAYFNMEQWRACQDLDMDLDDFAGEDCIGGADLASKVDMAAYVKSFRRYVDGKSHFYIFGNHYLPEDVIAEPENFHYQGWQIEGHLTATDGNVIDFERIRDDVLEDAQDFNLMEFAFDPFQATMFINSLMAHQIDCIEVPSQVRVLSEPMKWLDQLIKEGRVHYNGDPVMSWQIGNTVARIDAKDNVYPRKEKPESKIDAVVAIIMVLARWMLLEGERRGSVYENRGIEVF